MKFLKQLTLVTAVAAASTGAMAMEALSDEALSQKTGQDGITVKITPDDAGIIIGKLLVHDNDGLAADSKLNYNNEDVSLGGTAKAGAIVVNNLTIKNTSDSGITATVDTDAGADGAFINAAVNLGDTTISLDGVNVGKSGATKTAYAGDAQRGSVADSETKILGGLSLSLKNAKMNVQLGAQPQGAMVLMDADLTGGLKIENLEIIDANGENGTTFTDAAKADAGGLYVKKVVMTDAAGPNMKLAQKIDIDKDDGIVITMNSPTAGYYAYMEDVGVSSNPNRAAGTAVSFAGGGAIGDVEIQGLKLGNTTIAIKGH